MVLATQSCKDFLCWELTRRTRTNPRYSVRAFASQLGLSPGELSEILRGKRKLSLKAAAKIATRLGLNEDEARHLIRLATDEKLESGGLQRPRVPDASTEAPALDHLPLTAELFTLIADWYCLAILTLKDTRGFRWDTKWIAKRLGITEVQTRMAIERLVRVGMLEKKRKGYEAPKDFHIDPRGIPSEAIKSFHRQLLEKATEALELQPQDRREITGLTLPVDRAAIPAMKRDLTEFLKTFNRRYGKGRRLDAVYQLEFALFELTKETP